MNTMKFIKKDNVVLMLTPTPAATSDEQAGPVDQIGPTPPEGW
jgi:hypothetical protein